MKVSHSEFLGLKPEMRSVAKIILLSFITQVHAQELKSIGKVNSSTWDSMIKVVHKSIKPALMVWPLGHLDLDHTALVKTSGGIRGASFFTRAIVPLQVASTHSAWPCKALHKRSTSVRGHSTKLNEDPVSALPAPAQPFLNKLFQTPEGVVFGCVEGGSKPECFDCPFFKSLGRPQDPSMPSVTSIPDLDDLAPPDIDGLDDSTSDRGFNDELSAKIYTNVFCIIEIITMVLIGFFVGCRITVACCVFTDEGLCPLLHTGV